MLRQQLRHFGTKSQCSSYFRFNRTTQLKGSFLLLCCFLSFSSFAQVNIDSLKSVWNDPTVHDTTRLQAIGKMALRGFLYSHPDSAFYYASQQYTYAKSIDNQKEMAAALRTQGVSFLIQGSLDTTIYYLDQALEISTELGDKDGQSRALSGLGISYAKKGDFKNAIDIFMLDLRLGEEIGDETKVSGALSNIGQCHQYMRNDEEAIYYFNRSYRLAEKINNRGVIASSYGNLGAIHQENGAYDSALYYYNKSRDLLQELGAKSGEVTDLESIGLIYEELENYTSALQYYGEALKLAEEIGARTQISSALSSIGTIQVKRGDSAKAESNHTFARGQFALAIGNARQAYRLAEETGHNGQISRSSKLLSMILERQGAYKEALEMYQQFVAKRDSILSEENKAEVLRQGYQYDYEKKKLTDDLAHQLAMDKEIKQRYFLYLILGVLVVFTAFIYLAWIKRKRLSKALEISNSKLKELNLYKDSMTAMINHDLRTPLTLINGYITRILSNDDNYLTTETEGDLRNLERSSMKLIEMSEELQELLMLEEGRLTLSYAEVRMDEYLNILVSMFSSAADQCGVSLTYTSNVGNLTVKLDQSHFDKIVYNLLTNALRYTHEGDSIKVVLNKRKNSTFEILIEDTGIGISEESLPFIFDRFYQSNEAKREHKDGYGIGLSVVKQLIELHGGEITVDSTEGLGTIIRIVLPFNRDKQSSSEFNKDRIAGIKVSGPMADYHGMVGKFDETTPTILVVDDQEELRNYIVDLIGDGFQLRIAGNGREALKVLERDRIDLVLTDLMMPWMDGFDLIEEMKKNDRFKQVPIMVVSARTTEEDRLKILDQGVNNFLSKPFNPKELKRRISNILMEKSNGVASWDQVVKDKNILSNIEQDTLTKLNQFIVDRIDDSTLTIDEIANELNASRSKSINLVKSLTGKTPLAYIKSIRMEYVAHLISTGKVKNTSEAAKSIGMGNATQFANQYHKHFGRKPF